MIRSLSVDVVRTVVEEMIAEATYTLPPDYLQALAAARQQELSPLGQSIMLTLADNAAYAQAAQIPTCQDTGMAILFLEVGQDVHFVDGSLSDALHTAVKNAYEPLRKSVVADPVERTNTGDNTPPIINFQLVDGNQVKVTILLKGFGAEPDESSADVSPFRGYRRRSSVCAGND